MNNRISRRKVLGIAAAAAGASVSTRLFGAPAVLTNRSPNALLATAVIGCANQGISSLNAAAGERLVALVDVDDNHLGIARQSVTAVAGGRRGSIARCSRSSARDRSARCGAW